MPKPSKGDEPNERVTSEASTHSSHSRVILKMERSGHTISFWATYSPGYSLQVGLLPGGGAAPPGDEGLGSADGGESELCPFSFPFESDDGTSRTLHVWLPKWLRVSSRGSIHYQQLFLKQSHTCSERVRKHMSVKITQLGMVVTIQKEGGKGNQEGSPWGPQLCR